MTREFRIAQDEINKEDKFDFTTNGEEFGYIGLDQAWVQAMEHARDNTNCYGPSYAGIRLSFRPAGRFRGEPGVEQFIFDKTGDLRIRQLLDEPTDLGGRD